MKQVIQYLRTGITEVIELPVPSPQSGQLRIETSMTLVSSGTERMLLEFGQANVLQKIRSQPEKFRQVLDKVGTDGLLPTLEAVRAKLDEPIAPGYCNVGTVIDGTPARTGLRAGDRVVSNGPHAGIVRVPENLCARIPDGVTDETAAFTVLGAIALQGIRLIAPTIGETIAVTGLGLIGLLAVQILRANGCRVLALDYDATRLGLARRFGAETVDLASGEDPVQAALGRTGGVGIDGVLIAASTDSDEPVRQAARMCRKRGRIVLVGVTGLELSRADFYEKELSFQVSCSYGPGRYDPSYEQQGHDYPIGFVRWTEQRNFEAVLELMAGGRVVTDELVTHRIPVERAGEAYARLVEDHHALGIVLDFRASQTGSDARARAVPGTAVTARATPGTTAVALVGAGNYGLRVLAPALAKAGVRLKSVVTTGSVRGWQAARLHGFEQVSTDLDGVLSDPEIGALVVATRHDTHADLVLRAAAAGKSVFVEKPLATTAEQLERIASAAADGDLAGRLVTVGFNRRFAPLVQRMKTLLAGRPGPCSFSYMVNAGAIPQEHWTQDAATGGGRIIGEACHFIDLMRFLAGAPVTQVSAEGLRPAHGSAPPDTVAITLAFADGSVGTIQYFANGARSFPKERLEVFSGGAILRLDNYLTLRGFGWPGFRTLRRFRQDKGAEALATAFVAALQGRQPNPVPLEQSLEASRVAIQCAQAVSR